MMNYQPLYQLLNEANRLQWSEALEKQLNHYFNNINHGDLSKWQTAIENLPQLNSQYRKLTSDRVTIAEPNSLDAETCLNLENQLKILHPWRKGPYQIADIHIDTEWRSDWKWQRISPHISLLKNRLVLDIGCGNGYHCWRMLGEGAKMVIGIDPSLLNIMQFQAIRQLYGEAPVYVLPLGIEDLPDNLQLFDTVFSMGVLYHRRSPFQHLLQLKSLLRADGELVLETLVIEGSLGEVLVPEGRYASMRNVWFLPSCETLLSWMRRCGYKNARVVDVNQTSTSEQRSTEWMQFHSLQNYLDPENPNLTREGLPAPLRATFIANV